MRDIGVMARGGTGAEDNMKDMIKDSIKELRVLALLPVFPVLHSRLSKNTHPALGNRNRKIRNVGGSHELSSILDTILDTTSAILNVFDQASNAIPVPFVPPLVSSVASLLTAVQVSFRILVYVALRTNNCQQTHSNHGDMRQIAAVAGEFVVMLAESGCQIFFDSWIFLSSFLVS